MRVLLIGGSGFIGTAVLKGLELTGVDLVVGMHARPAPSYGPSSQTRMLDLTEPYSVAGCASDVDVVIHLASVLRGSRAAISRVNDEGTLQVAEEAARAGIRMVKLSTAAVYGPGPWRGKPPDSYGTETLSIATATRLRGDAHVLARGGTVVRPHLVLGARDSWVTPRVKYIVTALNGWPEPTTLHSTIHVDDLANVIIQLALGVDRRSGIVIASEPPMTLPQALKPFLPRLAEFERPVPLSVALDHREGNHDPRWQHDIKLMATDHYFGDGSLRG